MADTSILVRLIAASILVGLLAFCGAHVVQVWRKRNAKPGGRSPGQRRLSWACLLVGLILIPATAVNRELVRSEGTLAGEDMFVVRASEDVAVEWLREDEMVATGDLLARFGVKSARAEELQARLTRAEAECDVMGLLPLVPDPELTRRQQEVSLERAQVQQELGQVVMAVETAKRDLTAQLFTKKEVLARLEVTLTERRKELDRAVLRQTHASTLQKSFDKLSGTGSVSIIEYSEQVKELKHAEIEVASLTQEVKDLLAEKEVYLGQVDKLKLVQSDPSDPLRKQVVTLTARLGRMQIESSELKPKIVRDLARSTKLRKAEKAQLAAKVREYRAGVDGLKSELEVKAPFQGRLAYRTASPNAIRPRATLAVLAPADGFRLTARMAASDAGDIREGSEVLIDVGEGSPERRIPARFHQTVSLSNEPGYVSLQLKCQPPPEIVRRLAEGEKLTVAFAWRPPLITMWTFLTGVILIAVGMVGLCLKNLFRAAEPLSHEHRTDSILPPTVPKLAAIQPVENRINDSMDDLPETFEEVEVCYRDSLAELNKADSTQAAAALLKRLRRLRGIQRSMDPNPAPDRYDQLRKVLRSLEAPAGTNQSSGDALSAERGRS